MKGVQNRTFSMTQQLGVFVRRILFNLPGVHHCDYCRCRRISQDHKNNPCYQTHRLKRKGMINIVSAMDRGCLCPRTTSCIMAANFPANEPRQLAALVYSIQYIFDIGYPCYCQLTPVKIGMH